MTLEQINTLEQSILASVRFAQDSFSQAGKLGSVIVMESVEPEIRALAAAARAGRPRRRSWWRL